MHQSRKPNIPVIMTDQEQLNTVPCISNICLYADGVTGVGTQTGGGEFENLLFDGV